MAALEQGQKRARAILSRRRKRAAARRALFGRLAGARQSAGLLLAEGDSWFDYPLFDVLELLEEGFGYEVESVAHRGDTIEEMAYDPSQLDKLARRLEKLGEAGRVPRAVLLSGGGDDIAGDQFSVLLNHRSSSLPALNDRIVSGLVDERLRAAIVELASAVTLLCRRSLGVTVPILIHGYDYPVPDGRGYLGGFWLLPGPWLAPAFRRKGYPDERLRERCALMVPLLDRFNALLAGIAEGPGLRHMHYVDLRGALSSRLSSYKEWWSDEMHPTEKGFMKVAARFDDVIRGLQADGEDS